MPTYLSFAISIGSYFNFSFSLGQTPSDAHATSNVTTDHRHRPLSAEPLVSCVPALNRLAHDHDAKSGNHTEAQGVRGSKEHDSLPYRISLTNALGTISFKHLTLPESKDPHPEAPVEGEQPVVLTNESCNLATSYCSLFRLPVELRDAIYRELLVSSQSIIRAHDLIGNKTIVANNHHPITGLDSRIMRTCRKVYHETLPILYGRNVFEFHYPNAIRDFADTGMEKTSSLFDSNPTQPSRLILLKTLYLKFMPRRWSSFGQSALPPLSPERDEVWAEWSQTLFAEKAQSITLFKTSLALPSMEKLTLDLVDWQLSENEAVLVEPILRTLKKFPKLNWLMVRGISHQPTLEKLREGFCKAGTIFEVDN